MIELGERHHHPKIRKMRMKDIRPKNVKTMKEGLSSKEASSRWIEAIETGLSRERREVPVYVTIRYLSTALPMIIVGFVFIIVGAAGIRKHHEIRNCCGGFSRVDLCILNVLLEYRPTAVENSRTQFAQTSYTLGEDPTRREKQYHHHEGNFVACFRDKAWTWISPSLLVRGDIVCVES